jgi:uncharacterized protein YbaP (TraB family)
MLRNLILSASALALSACAFPTSTLAQEAAVAASGPAMWQVADEDTTVYLFGTVHFLPDGLDWYKPAIEAALTGADQFVSEIDTSAIPEMTPGQAPPPELMAIAQMQMQLAQLTTGGTLRDLMNEEDRGEYEAALAQLGAPPQAFDGFEPWFAFMTMSQLALMQAGLDPSAGVERSLDDLVEGKDRAAFETIEQQLGFFDNLPMEAQLLMLDQTAENLDKMDEGLQQMIDQWMAGDPDGLAAIINEEMSDPLLYEALLTRRNANWAEWIDSRMDQPGTVFIAVGAGHLAGEGSVQDYLAERGLVAQRVDY